MDKLIHIQKLAIGYNKRAIIEDINTSFSSGELICLIGRNGEGKSTLIKTLCKLIPPISGTILINNKDLGNTHHKEFANLISVVLTAKIAISNISVKEFISFGRYPYTNWIGKLNSKDEKLIDSAVKMCGVEKLTNRNFDSLSDGEKQKVNIARAIAQDTPIIILDEPTAHLDLVNNIEIFKLLQILVKNHNKTIIFSTHYMELALQMTDKVMVINQGKCFIETPKNIIEHGILNQLFDNKTVQYNAQLNKFEFNV
ncbi:MAG: ABC transporter ATP-binding protein [Flavobacteriales bacterium]